MAGLAPLLPLTVSQKDGCFELIKNYKDLVRQNLKMLLLTSPGERVMDLNYGVGIRDFLFLHHIESTYNDLDTRIRTQCLTYMPFLEIDDISFSSFQEDSNIDGNTIVIRISYNIVPLGENDLLELSNKIN